MDDEKPWYKTNALIITVVGAVLATVLGVVASQLTKSPPPPPPPTSVAPNSDQATLVLDPEPVLYLNQTDYQITGSGWNADNSVRVEFPIGHGLTIARRIAVHDGLFTLKEPGGAAGLEEGELYTLWATGEQSGHKVEQTFIA